MKKFFKILLLVVAVVLFIGTFVFLYQKSKPEVIEYETYDVQERTLEKTSVLTGDIEPRDEVLVKPQISGVIYELCKQAGEEVKAGEIIAKVKVIPDMQSLASAESRVRLATVNLEQAKVDYQREKKLYDEQLVSADEYDKVRQTYRQAKEELLAANDNYEIAKNGVSRSQAQMSTTLIRSTVNGLILDIPLKVGTSVIMSNSFNDGTTIATVANMGDLIFKGQIDETEVGRVHTGMPMKITVGALQDQSFTATLEYISPKVEAATTSSANKFEIKAAVKMPHGVNIRSGYSANAEIVLDRLTNVLSVPEGAVTYENGRAYVQVLTAATPQTFAKREVKTGVSDGMYIQILSGLKKGEKVRGNPKAQESIQASKGTDEK